jgi:methionyl-tRNA formyltransferase
MRAYSSPVKQFAAAHDLAVYQPHSLKDDDAAARVLGAGAAALVVAAYGLLLPPVLLAASRYGALNIHASLLPRWRGAAPIQRALLAGDRYSGISIMQMDAGLDTGPVLAQRSVEIAAEEDAGTLHDKLAALGAEMIVAALAELERGALRALPQSQEGVTYARKIDKSETMIDWSKPADVVERVVRAFRPTPGAAMRLKGESCKISRARVVAGAGTPGKVLEAGDRLVIACAEGALEVLELQRPGGRPLAAADVLRGRPLPAGTRLA